MDFIKKIPLCFYSPVFYNYLARQEKGIGGKFILAVTLLGMLLFLFIPREGFAPLRDIVGQAPEAIKSFPAMTLERGRLSIDKPSPYEIKLGTEPSVSFVFDTNYIISDIGALKDRMHSEKIVLLVTAQEVVALGKNDELRIHSFDDTRSATVTHEDWERFSKITEKWGLTFIVIFMVFGAGAGLFLYNLIATFFSAIVVYGLGFIFRASLEFDAAMRLAAAARFPAILFSGFLSSAAVGWLFWAAYLVFAVMAVKKNVSQ